MKMNFTIAVAPPFVHPMMPLPATPTHSVRKYGFFSEATRQRQVAKYGNLKRCESLSFSGDIESLEPSKSIHVQSTIGRVKSFIWLVGIRWTTLDSSQPPFKLP